MGYLNNYKGQPSYINTVLDAVTEEGKGSDGAIAAAGAAAAAGFEVVYAPGSEQVGTKGNASLIAEATVRKNTHLFFPSQFILKHRLFAKTSSDEHRKHVENGGASCRPLWKARML